MKKVFFSILIFLLLLTLSAGVFSCKKTKTTTEKKDSAALAADVVTAALSEDEDHEGAKKALLTLFSDASLEEAEKIAVLWELTSCGKEIAPALRDITAGKYASASLASYRVALQSVATAVSPEVAGRVFYAAAKKADPQIPYTSVDCEKLASLFLGEDAAFGAELMEKLFDGNTAGLEERQINTLMITLSASLKKAVGISSAAKERLLALLQTELETLTSAEDIGAEALTLIQTNKDFALSLARAFLDGYDDILSFTADYFAAADAELFLGLPYVREERTVYYGYKYDDWSTTFLTKEQYDNRGGGFDEYLCVEKTVKGFVVDGVFVPISDADAHLADAAYRLFTAYIAYHALPEEKRVALKGAVEGLLQVLSQEQGLVAAILDRPILEEDGNPGVTQEEFFASLPALSSFDATDGVSEAERSAAKNAVSLFERYLHGFLPKVF